MMVIQRLTLTVALALGMAVTSTQAGDVTIKDVHLCCGSCQSLATAALKKVPGVTGIACDRNSKIVTYRATDAKAATAGVAGLAKAGFHGMATHDKKPIAFPPSGAKQGQKANSMTIAGVHLCCTGCVTAAQKAVQKVEGVLTIEIDRNAKTLTLKGKAIDVVAAVTALNKGGFHGTVKK